MVDRSHTYTLALHTHIYGHFCVCHFVGNIWDDKAIIEVRGLAQNYIGNTFQPLENLYVNQFKWYFGLSPGKPMDTYHRHIYVYIEPKVKKVMMIGTRKDNTVTATATATANQRKIEKERDVFV